MWLEGGYHSREMQYASVEAGDRSQTAGIKKSREAEEGQVERRTTIHVPSFLFFFSYKREKWVSRRAEMKTLKGRCF